MFVGALLDRLAVVAVRVSGAGGGFDLRHVVVDVGDRVTLPDVFGNSPEAQPTGGQGRRDQKPPARLCASLDHLGLSHP
jgi:hypothetical protein